MKSLVSANGHIGRFLRFGIVGAVGVVINMGFYTLLYDLVHIYDLIAGAIAIELSILNNFILNDRWTFRDRATKGWKTWFKRCLAFHLSSGLVAMLAQLLTLYVLTRFLGMWDKLAYLIGIGIGALANYIICNHLIFRQKKVDEEELMN
jgi:dolichol-phosphate mannosyltransferase